MEDFIFEDFKHGVLLQIHEAERNILIWEYIGEESEFLKTQPVEVRQLYSFLQLASQTNFVLALGKLFDKPKNHPTQSILYFLKQVEVNTNKNIEIIEKGATKKLLKSYQAPEYLLNAVDSSDNFEFQKKFVKYYSQKYNSSQIQSDIEQVKFMRDKAIAHNEAIENVRLELDVARRLLKFGSEIVSIFGMAYHSTIWENETKSLITINAENNAWFVKSLIEKLKNH